MRLNRKKIIRDFETLRQGFRDAIDFGSKDVVFQVSMRANHNYADQIIVGLGGESVYLGVHEEENDIVKDGL